MQHSGMHNIDCLETCCLEPIFQAATPPNHTKICFPLAINAHVARVTSLFVIMVCMLATCFYNCAIVCFLVTSLFFNLSLHAIGRYTLSPYGVF